MIRKLFGKFLWDMFKENGAGSQGVITVYALFAGSKGYICSPQLSFFVLAHQIADEMIERRLAAGEFSSLMAFFQSFDGPVIHGDVFWPWASKDVARRRAEEAVGPAASKRDPGLGRRGAADFPRQNGSRPRESLVPYECAVPCR